MTVVDYFYLHILNFLEPKKVDAHCIASDDSKNPKSPPQWAIHKLRKQTRARSTIFNNWFSTHFQYWNSSFFISKYRKCFSETELLFIVVKLLEWKVQNSYTEISAKIFSWKLAYLVPSKVYTKNVPNIEVYNFIIAPLRTLPIKLVIVVLY